MATTYTKLETTHTDHRYIIGLMRFYHKPLSEADVTIDVLMASNPDGRAVKVGGYPALAKIKKTTLENRANGDADARLIIDAEYWEHADKAQRTALIDHELTHLVLVVKDGEVQRDDLYRPKLRMRLHDFEIGGFYEICERHKEKAVELQNVAVVKSKLESMRQLEFDWATAELMSERVEEDEAVTA